jgi:hypothetical protein
MFSKIFKPKPAERASVVGATHIYACLPAASCHYSSTSWGLSCLSIVSLLALS